MEIEEIETVDTSAEAPLVPSAETELVPRTMTGEELVADTIVRQDKKLVEEGLLLAEEGPDDDAPENFVQAGLFIKPNKKARANIKGAGNLVPEYVLKNQELADDAAMSRDAFDTTQGVNEVNINKGDIGENINTLADLEQQLVMKESEIKSATGDDAKRLIREKSEIEAAIFKLQKKLKNIQDDGLYKEYISSTFILNEGAALDNFDDQINKLFDNLADEGGAVSYFTLNPGRIDKKTGKSIEYQPSDVMEYINAIAKNKELQAVANTQRRGKLPNEQLLQLAKTLGEDPKKLRERILKTNKGEMWNAETFTAARIVLVDETRKLIHLAKLANNPETATPMVKHGFMVQLEMVNQIQARILGVRTEIARTMQSMQISVQGSQDTALMAEELNTLIRQHGGENQINDLAKVLAETIGVEDALAVAKNRSAWSRGYDAINEVRINSLLSSPVTQAKNIISAWGLITEEQVYLARTAQKEANKAKKDPNYIPKLTEEEALGYWYGMLNGINEAMVSAKLAYKYNRQVLPGEKWKPNTMREEAFSGEGLGMDEGWAASLTDTLGRIVTLDRIPTKLLTAGDQFNKNLAYNAKLYQLAIRELQLNRGVNIADDPNASDLLAELIANPTKEMKEQAILHAQRVTLTDELSKTSEVLNRLAQHRLGNLFVPFAKIPLKSAEYLTYKIPGLHKLQSNKKYHAAKEAGGAEWAKYQTEFNFMLGLGATWMTLGATGVCTGPAPKDKKIQAFNQSRGVLPMSCKIGDSWVSYQGIEPFSTIIGLYVGLGELAGNPNIDQSTFSEIALSGIATIHGVFTEQTLLQGFLELTSTISADWGIAHSLESTVKNIKEQFVPNAIKQGSKWIDGTKRMESEVDDWWDIILPDYARYTPWRSNQHAAPIDQFGEPVKHPDMWGHIKVSEQREKFTDDGREIYTELTKTGAGLPGYWQDTFFLEGIEIDVQNNKALEQMHIDAGKIFLEYLQEYIDTDYQGLVREYQIDNANFPGEVGGKFNEKITTIGGSSFFGLDPEDTKNKKKIIRKMVNSHIGSMFQAARKQASFEFEDNHPELWAEIEDGINVILGRLETAEENTDYKYNFRKGQEFKVK